MNRNKINSFQIQINNEIMATDTFIKVADTEIPEAEMAKDLNDIINNLRNFHEKFSRFIENNELSKFNNSEGKISVSTDLFEMLKISMEYYKKTNGYFDISILPYLNKEGYIKSKSDGYTQTEAFSQTTSKDTAPITSFEKLNVINVEGRVISKPKGLKIDLGGIGKGYAVKMVAEKLLKKYKNFVVDLGGDIYVNGENIELGYKYWAIGVENPKKDNDELYVLCLKNMGVATSGINRRNWILDGRRRNHLIDPFTHSCVNEKMLSSTVVSESIIEADILAKSLLIMELEKAMNFIDKHKLACILIDENMKMYVSKQMETYVCKS